MSSATRPIVKIEKKWLTSFALDIAILPYYLLKKIEVKETIIKICRSNWWINVSFSRRYWMDMYVIRCTCTTWQSLYDDNKVCKHIDTKYNQEFTQDFLSRNWWFSTFFLNISALHYVHTFAIQRCTFRDTGAMTSFVCNGCLKAPVSCYNHYYSFFVLFLQQGSKITTMYRSQCYLYAFCVADVPVSAFRSISYLFTDTSIEMWKEKI